MKRDRYVLTKSRMPLVYKTAESFCAKHEEKVLIGLPLTFETLCVVDALRAFFPNVMIIPQSSGPNSSTQTGVFKYLEEWNIPFEKSADEATRKKVLSWEPDVIIDCSCMLGEYAIENGMINENCVYIEDTKTGENRLHDICKSKKFKNTCIILDNSLFKRNYENSMGIGFSVVTALMSLGYFLPRYKVGVIGYGPVGYGVCTMLSHNGAEVLVCEIDENRKGNAAKRYSVCDKGTLLREVDMVVTATGSSGVITKKDIQELGKRIVLANAGGEDEWIREKMFDVDSGTPIHEHITEYRVGNSIVHELGGGNSINLVREISISEFLDITFAYLILIISRVRDIPRRAGNVEVDMFMDPAFTEMVKALYGEGDDGYDG